MSSSIHIGKVSSGSFLHNDRTQKVSYLIDDSSLNECSRSSSDCLAEYQSLKLQASENYTKLTNQKMQKSTIFLKEAIVNLQEHHTLKDLEPIKEKLESYGFKVLQMSIHRDEGFVNPENKKQKNYHAHITMFNLDVESGKSVKFGKNYRTELSRLQTFTANTLQMERGKVSVKEHANELKVSVSKASRRLDTHDYKKAMEIKEEAQNQLKKQSIYDFREMQQKITALENLTTQQKKELHSLNSAVKNDRGTIEQLNLKIQELTEHKKTFKEENKTLKFELQATNILQTTVDALKSDLNDLRADMSVLQASNDELTLKIGRKDKTIQNTKTKQKNLEDQLKSFDKDQSKPWFSRLISYVNHLNQSLKSKIRENQELKEKIKTLETTKSKGHDYFTPKAQSLEAQEYKSNLDLDLDLVEAYIKECEEKEKYADSNSDTELK